MQISSGAAPHTSYHLDPTGFDVMFSRRCGAAAAAGPLLVYHQSCVDPPCLHICAGRMLMMRSWAWTCLTAGPCPRRPWTSCAHMYRTPLRPQRQRQLRQRSCRSALLGGSTKICFIGVQRGRLHVYGGIV